MNLMLNNSMRFINFITEEELPFELPELGAHDPREFEPIPPPKPAYRIPPHIQAQYDKMQPDVDRIVAKQNPKTHADYMDNMPLERGKSYNNMIKHIGEVANMMRSLKTEAEALLQSLTTGYSKSGYHKDMIVSVKELIETVDSAMEGIVASFNNMTKGKNAV